ncbi:hypothetical protein ACWEQO_10540 [Streptomyces sp. NPDC004051]
MQSCDEKCDQSACIVVGVTVGADAEVPDAVHQPAAHLQHLAVPVR